MNNEKQVGNNEAEIIVGSKFSLSYSKLCQMTEMGLPFHQCNLFHDQLVQISVLDSMNIQPRDYTPGSPFGLPPFCLDMHQKLGCAHAGSNDHIFGGHLRARMSTARLNIVEGVKLLRQYSPDLLSEDEADGIIKRIELLGSWIAVSDIEMSTRRSEGIQSKILREHRSYVEEVFAICQKVVNLIAEAMRLGMGREEIIVDSKFLVDQEDEAWAHP